MVNEAHGSCTLARWVKKGDIRGVGEAIQTAGARIHTLATSPLHASLSEMDKTIDPTALIRTQRAIYGDVEFLMRRDPHRSRHLKTRRRSRIKAGRARQYQTRSYTTRIEINDILFTIPHVRTKAEN